MQEILTAVFRGEKYCLTDNQRAMVGGNAANLRRGAPEGNSNRSKGDSIAGIPAIEKPVVTQAGASEMPNVTIDGAKQGKSSPQPCPLRGCNSM